MPQVSTEPPARALQAQRAPRSTRDTERKEGAEPLSCLCRSPLQCFKLQFRAPAPLPLCLTKPISQAIFQQGIQTTFLLQELSCKTTARESNTNQRRLKMRLFCQEHPLSRLPALAVPWGKCPAVSIRINKDQ